MRVAVLLGMFAGIGCAQVTPEKELAMGLQLVANLETRQKMVSEPAVTGFLDGVVQALTRGEQIRIPLRLRVVTTADNVASALPGGFLLLSSGALGSAESEAELAALLAHAAAHAQAGMPPPSSTPLPVVFLGGPWGTCMRSVPWNSGVLAPASLTNAAISESAIDLVALRYLANAGYDPRALTSVFQRWDPRFTADATVRAGASAMAVPNSIVDTSRFEAIKAMLSPAVAPARPVPTLRR